MKNFTKLLYLIASLSVCWQADAIEVNKAANIRDTTTSIIGVNHIALSVKNLDEVLAFYQRATDFELVRREKVSQNKGADTLFGHTDIEYEVAVLKAPNMLFELTEFNNNRDAPISRMLAQGPGMTHTCFQSPSDDSGWDKFIKAGAEPLSRGGQPIDLGGYGVTYGYAYDPEGNMIELEQLDEKVLSRAGYDKTWKDLDEVMWMSQVALVTHDIERLMAFYEKVLEIQPYRVVEVEDNIKLDQIADIDDMHILGGWFRLNETSKVIEFWQYISPATQQFKGERDVTALGYSFSLEVSDIQKEYQRLSSLGLEFVSEPVKLGDFWQTYTRDLDGNVFSLRQTVDVDSEYSVRKMDIRKME
jgi:catechol 2,3-dioxygenase-like lactoylglutathione lyase family enzyme